MFRSLSRMFWLSLCLLLTLFLHEISLEDSEVSVHRVAPLILIAPVTVCFQPLLSSCGQVVISNGFNFLRKSKDGFLLSFLIGNQIGELFAPVLTLCLSVLRFARRNMM